jgi:hypothetical protein
MRSPVLALVGLGAMLMKSPRLTLVPMVMVGLRVMPVLELGPGLSGAGGLSSPRVTVRG